MTALTILVKFGLLYVVIGMIQSVNTAAQRLDENTGKVKGDLGDLISPTDNTQLPVSPPKWNALNLKTFEAIPSHKNKGDYGVMDPRGTVRYNILESGRIARGSITSLADEDSPIQQAKVKSSHTNTYVRTPVSRADTED